LTVVGFAVTVGAGVTVRVTGTVAAGPDEGVIVIVPLYVPGVIDPMAAVFGVASSVPGAVPVEGTLSHAPEEDEKAATKFVFAPADRFRVVDDGNAPLFTWYVRASEDGDTPIAPTAKVTGTCTEGPPTAPLRTEMFAVYCPAASPVGSATIVTVAGVVTAALTAASPVPCFTFSQAGFDVLVKTKYVVAEGLLLMVSDWLCAAPPTCAEKDSEGLSTLVGVVSAYSAPAAKRVRTKFKSEKSFFK